MKRKILSLFFVLLFVLMSVLPCFASETEDATPEVMKDLEGMTFGGEPFDADTTFADREDLTAIVLKEEFFTYDTSERENFALYLYLYNPTQTVFDLASSRNMIQLGVPKASLDADGNTVYEDADSVTYAKFALEHVSSSEDGRFIKLKVIDAASFDGLKIVQSVERKSRRYAVSGVELVTSGETSAHDYPIGTIYVWTGFDIGCAEGGANGQSSLTCTTDALEVIELNVKSTTWRTRSVIDEAGTKRHQLDSVWFTMPEKYLTNYGNLVGVKAKWNGTYTKPLYLTDVPELYHFYNAVTYNYNFAELAEPLKKLADRPGYGFGKLAAKNTEISNNAGTTKNSYWFDASCNMVNGTYPAEFLRTDYIDVQDAQKISRVNHMLYLDSAVSTSGNFSFKYWQHYYASAYENKYGAVDQRQSALVDGLSGDVVLKYFLGFSLGNDIGKLTTTKIGGLDLSTELFEIYQNDTKDRSSGNLPEDGPFGPVVKEFTLDGAGFDLKPLEALNGTNEAKGFWDNLVSWLFGTYEGFDYFTVYENVQPLMMVEKSDIYEMSLSSDEDKQAIADKYYIAFSDVESFVNDCRKTLNNGDRVYILRFAHSEYVCEEYAVYDYDGLNDGANPRLITEFDDKNSATKNYVTRTQEAVFFGFDIIEMTLKDEFKTTVLPVVSDPKDVIGSIGDVSDKPFDNPFEEIPGRVKQATKDFDWSKILKIISLVLLVIVVIILLPVLGPFFKLLLNLLAIPIRALASLFSRKRKKKNEDKKE